MPHLVWGPERRDDEELLSKLLRRGVSQMRQGEPSILVRREIFHRITFVGPPARGLAWWWLGTHL